MRPTLDFAGHEIQGTREAQEDFHVFRELPSGGLLLVLADGVGGESGGELASHTAVQGFLDSFAETGDAGSRRFPTALQRANDCIAKLIDETPGGDAHMATTLLALRIEGFDLHWISVGDSPLLLFRRGGMFRLNDDHSGKARQHRPGLGRHALSSALTGDRIEIIDSPNEPYALKPGDLIVAGSDGLWTLALDEIARYLADHADEPATKIASGLLARVAEKKKAHQDNATAALIKIGPPSSS